jgi:hypothetical protein
MSLLVLVADTVTGKIRGFDSAFTTRVKTANGFGGLGGTVTSVSVVTANGISGTVANPTTAPAITLDASAAIDDAVAAAVASLEGQLAAAIADLEEQIEDSVETRRWEPVTNGDVDDPEILFVAGDVVMSLVED